MKGILAIALEISTTRGSSAGAAIGGSCGARSTRARAKWPPRAKRRRGAAARTFPRARTRGDPGDGGGDWRWWHASDGRRGGGSRRRREHLQLDQARGAGAGEARSVPLALRPEEARDVLLLHGAQARGRYHGRVRKGHRPPDGVPQGRREDQDARGRRKLRYEPLRVPNGSTPTRVAPRRAPSRDAAQPAGAQSCGESPILCVPRRVVEQGRVRVANVVVVVLVLGCLVQRRDLVART